MTGNLESILLLCGQLMFGGADKAVNSTGGNIIITTISPAENIEIRERGLSQEELFGYFCANKVPKEGEYTAIITADKMRYITNCKDGKAEGKQAVHEDNEIVLIVNYKNGVLEGPFKDYSERGLETKGQYSRGKQVGEWMHMGGAKGVEVKDYYDNGGELLYSERSEEGRLTDINYFYKVGDNKIWVDTEYKEGKLQGIKVWVGNKLEVWKIFKEGKLVPKIQK